ncbi:hypothetical protein LguiB_034767 [Lonicera macranthoides]
MEQKHMLMSALSVGIGVGVGIGLASGQTVSRWTSGNSSENTITPQIMEQEVLNLIVDGKDSKVTFDDFPYYLRGRGSIKGFERKREEMVDKSSETESLDERRVLSIYKISPLNAESRPIQHQEVLLRDFVSVDNIKPKYCCFIYFFDVDKQYCFFVHHDDSEQTRVLLTSAAFVHLKTINFSKHTRNLSPASRTILLSGPAELYQQMLVKALARYFDAKLLLLDVTDFSLKIQSKYGTSKGSSFQRSTSETTLARMSGLFGSFSSILPPREETKGTLRRQSSGIEIGPRGTESLSNPPKLRRNASASANLNNLSNCTPANPGQTDELSLDSIEEESRSDLENNYYLNKNKKGLINNPLFNLLEQEFFWEDEELISLFSKDKKTHLCFDHFESDPFLVMARKEVLDWIVKVKEHYGFSVLTAVLAINYSDRYILSSSNVEFQKDKKPWMIQLVAVTCLSWAARIYEIHVPLLLDLQVEDTNGVADGRFVRYLPSVLATATMLHVIEEAEPSNPTDYQHQLLGALKITKEEQLSRISRRRDQSKNNRAAVAYYYHHQSITQPSICGCSPLQRTTSWSFDEKLFIQTLYKVLVSVSKTTPIVLYLRDVEKLLCRSQRVYVLFQKMLKRLSGPILILGSRIVDNEYSELDERLTSVFPYNIEIRPPEDESHLVSWKKQLEEDMKMIQYQDNRNHIAEVLAANDLDCEDLGSICMADTIVLSNYIEEIVVSAISYHLMSTKDPEYRNGKLVISSARFCLSHGLNLFQEGKSVRKDTSKLETQAELPKDAREKEAVGVKPETKGESTGEAGASAKNDDTMAAALKAPEIPDNEFEKRIRPEVIPASEIGVTFADIGALDEIKESLQELVMLPLRRPDLFKGGLLKPCRGILLFGPPGTGKTMMAKAIANEAGASFINVSMSTITSKWFGEDEKNVRALFTLAAKVSPTIIFVDEVDSMLGQRSRAGEHEAMRKIKNEFMTHWDGLLTKQGERILVLAATNRPFDLDEAIIRRFERRILVGLPSVENREKILRTVLVKENVDKDLDFKELATMTEGYSGSDLKNLCTTAAYRPVRELIQQERLKDLEKKKRAEQGKDSGGTPIKEDHKEEKVITIRPLNMGDFKEAKNQVAASFAAEGSIMSELKQWNDLYGEGGSRKKEQLSYFL